MLRPNRCLDEIIKSFQPIKNYVLKSLNSVGRSGTQENSMEMRYLARNSDSCIQPGAHLARTEGETLGKSSEPSKDLQQPTVTSNDGCLVFPGRSADFTTPTKRAVSQQYYESPSSSQSSKDVTFPSSPMRIHHQTLRPSSSHPPVKEVACPICNTTMRETMINIHLDFCLNKNKPAKRKPMPKLIYNLMKDQELRKRLRELGLSTSGDKATLITRHKKYTILYNSECDATQPRSIEELKIQFEQEEAESRRLVTEARLAAATVKIKAVDPETIEKENSLYLQRHKESFDRLIKEIKQRTPLKVENQQPCKEEKLETKDSDDEVTVLEVPPKVYETISLSDSSDSDEPSTAEGRTVSAGSTSTSERQDVDWLTLSSCSIPDPMESSDSIQSSGPSSIEVQSAPSSSTESNTRTPSPSYSPTEASSNLSASESNSECSDPALENPVTTKASKKRSKSPSEVSERRMSLRRRV